MNFVSSTFLIFILCTFFFYYLFPLKYRWITLLLASIVFYLSGGWEKILFVLAAAAVVYFVALKMEKIYNEEDGTGKEKAVRKKEARRFLVAGITVVFLFLLYAKIGQSLVNTFVSLGGRDGVGIKLIIPLGISYYTFSIVGYLADVYWGKEAAEHNYLRLLLYMLYFPAIVEGPISRHKKLAPQLAEGHKFDYQKFCFGLQRIAGGYFKKLVIADRFAVIVNEIYSNYTNYTGMYFLVATLASAIQLYTDFSGCMDIVIGISECVGIELDENFQRPFFAKSAAEFWRRWHITLGAWFKDYVYMPLVTSPRLMKLSQITNKHFGKKAAKNILAIIPLAVVWLLTGLWHGTGANYVVWGVYWGGIIIISTVCAADIKKLDRALKIDTEKGSWKKWQMVRTGLIFCGGRLLTATGGLRVTVQVVKRIFMGFQPAILFDGSMYRLGLDKTNLWIGILAMVLLWYISCQQEKGVKIREKIASYPLLIRWTLYYALIFMVLIFGMYGPGYNSEDFVYRQF